MVAKESNKLNKHESSSDGSSSVNDATTERLKSLGQKKAAKYADGTYYVLHKGQVLDLDSEEKHSTDPAIKD